MALVDCRNFCRWLATCVVATSCSIPPHHEASSTVLSQLAEVASYSSFLATTTSDQRQKLLNFALSLPVGEAALLMLDASESATGLGSLLAGTALVGSKPTSLGEALSAIGIKSPKLLTTEEFSAAVQAQTAHAISLSQLSSPLQFQPANGLSLLNGRQTVLLDDSSNLCSDLQQQYVSQSGGQDISTLVQRIAKYVTEYGNIPKFKVVLDLGANRTAAGAGVRRQPIFTAQEVRSYYCYCLKEQVPGDVSYRYYPPECPPPSDASGASDSSASTQDEASDTCSAAGAPSCSSATSAQLEQPGEPTLIDTTGYNGGASSSSYIISHGSNAAQ